MRQFWRNFIRNLNTKNQQCEQRFREEFFAGFWSVFSDAKIYFNNLARHGCLNFFQEFYQLCLLPNLFWEFGKIKNVTILQDFDQLCLLPKLVLRIWQDSKCDNFAGIWSVMSVTKTWFENLAGIKLLTIWQEFY